MAVPTQDDYSATVESYLVVAKSRYRIAKSNGETITLDEDCELPPATSATLEISVDGDVWVRRVALPGGAQKGQRRIAYRPVAD